MEKVCIIKTINPLREGWRGGAESKVEGSRQGFLWDGGVEGLWEVEVRLEGVSSLLHPKSLPGMGGGGVVTGPSGLPVGEATG